MLLQSDLDYIFRIGFEIIKKYPVKIYGSVDLFNSIFFQGHLRLFLPLPLVCYNKMVKKKIHMHEEWQSRHRSKHEYVIGPFKKYYPTRSCHFFFFLNVFSYVQIRCPVFKNLFIAYLERSLKI